MKNENVKRAASMLLKARTSSLLIGTLPTSCTPRNLEEAYQIQEMLTKLPSKETEGWFIECANPKIQNQMGLPQPFSARLLSGSIKHGPMTIDLPRSLSAVVEVEFAFRLGHDLPPRQSTYSEPEVLEAVSTVHPSIEVFIPHFDDFLNQNIFNLIADNGTGGFLVVGEGATSTDPELLRRVKVSLLANGEIVREGTGANIMEGEGPLSALTLLANQPYRHPGLCAGHFISTGTCTEMYFARRGDQLEADFGKLGNVVAQICE